MIQRPRNKVPSGSILALPDPRRPDRANPPTTIWWSVFFTALAWSTCTGFPLDRQVNMEYHVEVLVREFRKRFLGKRAITLQIGSVAFPAGTMHQSTFPSFLQTIWPKWESKQFVSLPIVQPLLPVTFYLFPKLKENLRGCKLWDNCGNEKGCDECH